MNKLLLFILLLFIADKGFGQSNRSLTLWYNFPSGNIWENALPIGNGKLGAMIYGNVEKEIIQLNESTVWSGSPNRNDNLRALDSLQKIRALIFDGKHKQAEQLANSIIISKKSHGQAFQPVGDLYFNFSGHEKYSNYYRDLDIANAITTTRYDVKGTTYYRKALASLDNGVIVIELTANKPGAISFTSSFATVQPNAKITADNLGNISVSGTTVSHEGVPGMVKFKGAAKFKNKGGTLSQQAKEISIKNADTVTIYIAIATNFISYNDLSGDENAKVANLLKNASSKSFQQSYQQHRVKYRNFFNRVKLNLGTSQYEHLPTDVRLRQFAAVNDPQFAALYFQYGRYLLISSSAPGGQPANLQGIFNNKLFPPWDSKYTLNINAEMNYWPAEKTNLAELHLPFLQMVKELAVTGEETAKKMYGARGWMAHHNTDIWRATGAVDGAFWGLWVHGGGWPSQHLWEHYLYSGDKVFLKQAYPILKGAAMFYVDFLVRDPKTRFMVINPDTSPENAPEGRFGSSLDAGTTMSNQIVYDVFTSVINAAKILQKDEQFIDTLKQMRNELPPMQIGQYGQLQEWMDDLDNPHDRHRHVSHLYGLFPSHQISPYHTPELYQAAKKTLIQRGDVSTGWSMGWKVNWWARLLDGNHAYKLIQNQLSPVGVNKDGGGTYNNLFDAHPPFQIDGNFGCTSGIAEMLVQSGSDEILLLPALPDEWKKMGNVSGLRTKGGFEVTDLAWEHGKVVKLHIKSNLGGNLRLRVPNRLSLNGKELIKANGKNSNQFFDADDKVKWLISAKAPVSTIQIPASQLYDVSTQKGKSYTFLIKQ
ncbi:glycoside hydrolase family 95 protein [Pedobacter sp.]|uniref:glycoside hydrolase family 95 protein n=1 Tax=Pedobacter sp. TaxID=1411316 RepID=UPI0031D3F6C4